MSAPYRSSARAPRRQAPPDDDEGDLRRNDRQPRCGRQQTGRGVARPRRPHRVLRAALRGSLHRRRDRALGPGRAEPATGGLDRPACAGRSRQARAGGGLRLRPGRREHLAALRFRTTAFDIAETAIRGPRERFPDSRVDYRVADLLEPPAEWAAAFDLVVESITVQSLPLSVRASAIEGVRRMVAPGGQLLVISGIREEGEHVDGPLLCAFRDQGHAGMQADSEPFPTCWM